MHNGEKRIGSWHGVADSGNSTTPRLWIYGLNGQSSDLDIHKDIFLITHGWLGWGKQTAPSNPLRFTPTITRLAKTLSNASLQVLFLDWGQQALDPFPTTLTLDKVAGSINAVTRWAQTSIQPNVDAGKSVTLAGYSLGAYAAGQLGVLLATSADSSRPNIQIAALDPSASFGGRPYDLDGSTADIDPIPNFSHSGIAYSIALSVAKSDRAIGLAGDSLAAASAQQSYLVKGFSKSTSAASAHNAIRVLYADLNRYLPPNVPLSQDILYQFAQDQFDDAGTQSGIKNHEALVTITEDHSQIQYIDGYDKKGGDIRLHFIDSNPGNTRLIGSKARHDSLISLSSIDLRPSSSIEKIVLVGNDAINAMGGKANQTLIGNNSDNVFSGGKGVDLLTGNGGSDTFSFSRLAHCHMHVSRRGFQCDRITDYETTMDRINAPGNARRHVGAIVQTSDLSVQGFKQLLRRKLFDKHAAAVVAYTPPRVSDERLFLVLNDSMPGFNYKRDGIIEITGLAGDPAHIMIY